LSISALSDASPPYVESSSADDPTVRVRRPSHFWLMLCAALAASGAFAYWHLGRGFIPHDDGALAQAAERVLLGQLPHRDFDDVYTGGLAMLDSLGFRAFGITLWSMRLVLFLAFLAWVPAVFYVATRFARPIAAATVTLLAVAWSVPAYPAPMPSWYNLFLATAGVAAVLRHLERPQRRMLVVAGIAGGLSILVKVVGLYYVAGVLLFFVFEAHATSRAETIASAHGPASIQSGALYRATVSVGLLLFLAALLGLVHHGLHASEMVHFVVPTALIVALLARNEWTYPAGSSRARFRRLVARIGPFLAGLALPLVLFALPYARSGSLHALVNGVFILPTKRFGGASMSLLPLATLAPAILLLALVWVARRWPGVIRGWVATSLIVSLALVFVVSARSATMYEFVWYTVRAMVLVLVSCGVLLLDRSDARARRTPLHRSQLMLLLGVTALCSLVQFPFAAPIYFCYVAPLVVLLASALYGFLQPLPPLVPRALAGFLLAFAIFRVDTSAIDGMGSDYRPYPATQPLDMARGGIAVRAYQADEYRGIEHLLREHARGGYTWASPDSPEVYFLTGLRNPTRALFEFFDDPSGREQRLLAALDEHAVTAIVLNREPEFSPPITNEMFAQLARRYPAWADVGHFHVRWRP
jgi:hypothetical protein